MKLKLTTIPDGFEYKTNFIESSVNESIEAKNVILTHEEYKANMLEFFDNMIGSEIKLPSVNHKDETK